MSMQSLSECSGVNHEKYGNYTANCEAPYTDPSEFWVAAVTALAVFVNLALLGWAIKNLRKKKAVFTFVVIVSVGASVLLCSVFAWPLNDTDNTCLAKPSLFAVGAGLMFGMICSRIFKVWYCFFYLRKQDISTLQRFQRSKLNRYDIYLVLCSVMLLELILLIVLYAVPDYRPECQCLPFTEQRDQVYTLCSWSTEFGIVIVVVNLVPVLLAGITGVIIGRRFRKMESEDGTILGIARKEIDEFYPMLKALFIIFVLFCVAAAFTVFSAEPRADQANRRIYYILRSLFLIFAVMIPVGILYLRRIDVRYSKADRKPTVKSNPPHGMELRKVNGNPEKAGETIDSTAASTTLNQA